jgi:hypothetical protein
LVEQHAEIYRGIIEGRPASGGEHAMTPAQCPLQLVSPRSSTGQRGET